MHRLTAFASLGLFVFGLAETQGALIAHDAFLTGGSQHYNATDITTQNPTVQGFSGAWKDGNTATATWAVQLPGLDSPAQGAEAGGRARYSNFGGTRLVYRSLDSYPTAGTYYMSGLARLDEENDVTGMNVTGFIQESKLTDVIIGGGGTSEQKDARFFDTNQAKDIEGLMWGFKDDDNDGNLDLILRHRYDPDPTTGNQGQQMLEDVLVSDVALGETHLIVAKVEMNVFGTITTGNDRVSVWIDPMSGSEAGAGAPDYTFVDFALSAPDHITAMIFANGNLGNQVSYDENRFGTTWESVVVPEPATLLVWSLLAVLGIGAGWRRRR